MSDNLAVLYRLSAPVVYHRHNCTAAHRTYARAARCIWHKPRHTISGEGPYALLETYWTRLQGHFMHIRLFSSLEEAEKEEQYLASLHALGPCCGSCLQRVRVVILARSVAEGVRSKEKEAA